MVMSKDWWPTWSTNNEHALAGHNVVNDTLLSLCQCAEFLIINSTNVEGLEATELELAIGLSEGDSGRAQIVTQ